MSCSLAEPWPFQRLAAALIGHIDALAFRVSSPGPGERMEEFTLLEDIMESFVKSTAEYKADLKTLSSEEHLAGESSRLRSCFGRVLRQPERDRFRGIRSKRIARKIYYNLVCDELPHATLDLISQATFETVRQERR